MGVRVSVGIGIRKFKKLNVTWIKINYDEGNCFNKPSCPLQLEVEGVVGPKLKKALYKMSN